MLAFGSLDLNILPDWQNKTLKNNQKMKAAIFTILTLQNPKMNCGYCF